MADNAHIRIYDPKVTESQIHNDLSLDKFMWDHPSANGTKSPRHNTVSCFADAYAVRCPRSHAWPRIWDGPGTTLLHPHG